MASRTRCTAGCVFTFRENIEYRALLLEAGIGDGRAGGDRPLVIDAVSEARKRAHIDGVIAFNEVATRPIARSSENPVPRNVNDVLKRSLMG